jgi:hypothetical protein
MVLGFLPRSGDTKRFSGLPKASPYLGCGETPATIDWTPFCNLVINASQAALVEILALLATAEDNTAKPLPFYQEILEFLHQSEDFEIND